MAKRHSDFAALQSLFPFKLFLFVLACFGLLLSAAALLLQVGAINQNGVRGMFDWLMVQLLAQSNIGGGNGLRALAFVLLGVVSLSPATNKRALGFPRISTALYLLGLLCFASSFAYLGHVATQSSLARVAIVLHIGAVGLWLGALLPLWILCWRQEAGYLLPLMRAFGDYGWWIIATLVLAGGYLVTVLITSPSHLFSSLYGLMLGTKLLLVMCLLALAASNKFILVKRLNEGRVLGLRRSIGVEMILALIIMLVTAALTTFTGPMEMAA
ncbi:MAG: CopD family protein [Pseudohongiellaceae bacterium]|nr:CopD family protein [Pseudohongiellaceae bacterium]